MLQKESAEIAKSYLLQWYVHYSVYIILIYYLGLGVYLILLHVALSRASRWHNPQKSTAHLIIAAHFGTL